MNSMPFDSQEERIEVVAETSRPDTEAINRFAWAEPTIWTAAMLRALDNGASRRDVWFSLIDKINRPDI